MRLGRLDDRLDAPGRRPLPGVSVGTLSYILVGAIIGVFTSGMLIVVKAMPLPDSSPCAQRLNASSAAFEAT